MRFNSAFKWLNLHIYKAFVRTSQSTFFASIKDPNFLRRVAVYCENNAEYVVIPPGLNAESLVLGLALRILTSRLQSFKWSPRKKRKCGGRRDITGWGLHTGQ
jgi:hypothetical protein